MVHLWCFGSELPCNMCHLFVINQEFDCSDKATDMLNFSVYTVPSICLSTALGFRHFVIVIYA